MTDIFWTFMGHGVSSTPNSKEKGLANSPALCYFIFGRRLFSEPLRRPRLPAFPHLP